MNSASLTDFADSGPTLNFGKHRGTPLSEIESSYLEWVKTTDRITPALIAAIDAELATRGPKQQDKHTRTAGDISETGHLYARMIIELGAAAVREACGMDHHIGEAETFLQRQADNALLNTGSLPF